MKNVEAIATASPRMHGMSLGPADLAASRAMKTTRVGGGHPEYKVIADPAPEGGPGPWRSRTSGITRWPRWSMPARQRGSSRSTARSETFGRRGLRGAVPQRLPARLRGRLDAAPSQIDIAKRVFSPDPGEVLFAKRILEAMPDGSGAVMIDGKMQDDATWKQAKVIVDLARQVAARDPALAEHYGM